MGVDKINITLSGEAARFVHGYAAMIDASTGDVIEMALSMFRALVREQQQGNRPGVMTPDDDFFTITWL